MRVSTPLSLLSLSSLTTAYWKGFNLGATLPSTGACKTQADWLKDFTAFQSLPSGGYTAVRLYASSDCNTLASAVPAALQTNTKILVGIWAEDDAHYDAEKQALLAAIKAHGSAWIIAVSVGSEDLYRYDTSPSKVAQQIYDVRGMLTTVPAQGVQVGHVDTWTAWVNASNAAVISACDWIGTDGYPYWQGSQISSSHDVFWQSVNAVRDVVNKVKPGAWVWITETGWPVSGKSVGQGVPSTANAQAYWKAVACDEAFAQANTFWYAGMDYNDSPSFGVLGGDYKPLFDLSC